MTAMRSAGIEALLFDKDGTLFDFEATWGVWAAGLLLRLADGDLGRAAYLGDIIGYDYHRSKFLPDSFVIAGTPDDLVTAFAPEFPSHSRQELITMINDQAEDAPMTEAVPLDPLLRQFAGHGLRLGVATNDAVRPAYAHLDGVGVRDHFDFIAGSDSGFGAKPEIGQLTAFCDAVGVAPRDTVMIGDSTHDLLAGRAAGMWTVAVLTGPADTDALKDHADVVLPDIGHLPSWLGLD
ncbi:HAD family hydrolase [Marivita sp. S0852]|uniref:HAD family hydrolase n=1 Tax=Marivita sp. S0852 TaxID=3373893 RepID=UPI00398255A6